MTSDHLNRTRKRRNTHGGLPSSFHTSGQGTHHNPAHHPLPTQHTEAPQHDVPSAHGAPTGAAGSTSGHAPAHKPEPHTTHTTSAPVVAHTPPAIPSPATRKRTPQPRTPLHTTPADGAGEAEHHPTTTHSVEETAVTSPDATQAHPEPTGTAPVAPPTAIEVKRKGQLKTKNAAEERPYDHPKRVEARENWKKLVEKIKGKKKQIAEAEAVNKAADDLAADYKGELKKTFGTEIFSPELMNELVEVYRKSIKEAIVDQTFVKRLVGSDTIENANYQKDAQENLVKDEKGQFIKIGETKHKLDSVPGKYPYASAEEAFGAETVNAHLQKFAYGAHMFVPSWVMGKIFNGEIPGLGRGSNFVSTQAEGDNLLQEAKGTEEGKGIASIEKALGVTAGNWQNPQNEIYSWRVKRPDLLRLRMPHGSEAGAYQNEWYSGGKTEGGKDEAIIDNIPATHLPQLIKDGVIEINKITFNPTFNPNGEYDTTPLTHQEIAERLPFKTPPAQETRHLSEETEVRVLEHNKLTNQKTFGIFGGEKLKKGKPVEVDYSSIIHDGEGGNNLFVKIAGTNNKYVRLTKLSMHLPSQTSGLPEKADPKVFTEAKGALGNLTQKSSYPITKKQKTVKEELTGAEYRDREEKGFLSDAELTAIQNLSQSVEGQTWLRENGFLNHEEMKRWASDPHTAGLWERYHEHNEVVPLPEASSVHAYKVSGEPVLSHLQRLQITTYQRNLGKTYDEFKKTPGYIRYQADVVKNGSPEEKQKMQKEIFKQDQDTWINTLMGGANGADLPNGAGVSKANVEQTAHATDILKRIFVTLHDGLMYTRRKQGEELHPWEEDVAVALSHGGRIMIPLPKIEGNEDPHQFINWLFGDPKTHKQRGIGTRLFSSHGVQRSGDEPEEVKKNTVTALPPITRLFSGLATRPSATHYEMDLPIGGLGNKDIAGGTILPDGRHGHMYVYYDPPTKDYNGAVLIGFETSRMGRTDVAGQYHDMRGAPAEISPVGTAKAVRIGHEFGGRVVDLRQNFAERLNRLKNAEGAITRLESELDLAGKKEMYQRLTGQPMHLDDLLASVDVQPASESEPSVASATTEASSPTPTDVAGIIATSQSQPIRLPISAKNPN